MSNGKIYHWKRRSLILDRFDKCLVGDNISKISHFQVHIITSSSFVLVFLLEPFQVPTHIELYDFKKYWVKLKLEEFLKSNNFSIEG